MEGRVSGTPSACGSRACSCRKSVYGQPDLEGCRGGCGQAVLARSEKGFACLCSPRGGDCEWESAGSQHTDMNPAHPECLLWDMHEEKYPGLYLQEVAFTCDPFSSQADSQEEHFWTPLLLALQLLSLTCAALLCVFSKQNYNAWNTMSAHSSTRLASNLWIP